MKPVRPKRDRDLGGLGLLALVIGSIVGSILYMVLWLAIMVGLCALIWKLVF